MYSTTYIQRTTYLLHTHQTLDYTPLHLLQPVMPLAQSQKRILLAHMHSLLQTREYPKTICPSEIARALSAPELETLDASEWREAMDDIRQLVWELRQSGQVEVLQRGQVVQVDSLDDIKGPIRVRNKR